MYNVHNIICILYIYWLCQQKQNHEQRKKDTCSNFITLNSLRTKVIAAYNTWVLKWWIFQIRMFSKCIPWSMVILQLNFISEYWIESTLLKIELSKFSWTSAVGKFWSRKPFVNLMYRRTFCGIDLKIPKSHTDWDFRIHRREETDRKNAQFDSNSS